MTRRPSSTSWDSGERRSVRRRRVAAVAVAANVALLALKAGAGLVTGSLALLASAADSLIDLIAAGVAYLGVRFGGMEPDHTHAYGHDKFESLSGLVQLAILLVTVLVIVVNAVDRLGNPQAVSRPLIGVPVMVVTMVVAWWLSRRLYRVAGDTGGSQALEADALHLAADVWSYAAVIVGLVAVRLGIPVADPLTAFAVAAWIVISAVPMLRETTGVLLDRAPDQEVITRLQAAIQSMDEVVDHHTLRARLVGKQIFLDVVVELTPELTFREAHEVSHRLQDALRAAEPRVADAVIHCEPADHEPHHDRHHHHGFDALAYGRDRRRGP